MTTTSDARTLILEQLLPGETLVWFARPSVQVPWRAALVGWLAISIFIKALYFEGYLLIRGEFPPVSTNRYLDSFLIFLLGAIISGLIRGARPRRMRKSGQGAFALTDQRFMILRKSTIQSLDKPMFEVLHNIRILRGQDVVFEFTDPKKDRSLHKVYLYGVRDALRVACLIRHTLAPQTFTRNLEGAEA